MTRGADSGRPGVRRHNAGVVVRTRIRLAALVALVGITAACSGESHFTAPNAFCDAGAQVFVGAERDAIRVPDARPLQAWLPIVRQPSRGR